MTSTVQARLRPGVDLPAESHSDAEERAPAPPVAPDASHAQIHQEATERCA